MHLRIGSARSGTDDVARAEHVGEYPIEVGAKDSVSPAGPRGGQRGDAGGQRESRHGEQRPDDKCRHE